MGGGNATVVVAVLPVAAIWLLTRQPGPRRRALMGWWIVAVVAACFWWVVPLILTSGLTYNYLPFTETPAVTTSTASAYEALRGASYWLDYYALGGPNLPGAWTIVSSTVAIVGTTVITAARSGGTLPPHPGAILPSLFPVLWSGSDRDRLCGCRWGSVGAFRATTARGSAGSSAERWEISPAVALPLSISLAFLVSVPTWSRIGARKPRRPRGRWVPAALIGSVAVAALIIVATPFWRLDLYKPGGSRPFQIIGPTPGLGSTNTRVTVRHCWSPVPRSPTTHGATPKMSRCS